MCQLAAYIGDRPIAATLLDSLRLQEGYLGAHATGLAVLNDGKISLVKDCGHVDEVIRKTEIDGLTGTTGIAHSRYNIWAAKDPRYNTAGASHPWTDETGKLVLMHNGDIKNCRMHYEQLKEKHAFESYIEEFDYITDSEVAIHLLSETVQEGKTVPEALRDVASKITGQFLLGVMSTDHHETVWIANWLQPCYVAIGEDEVMFSSARLGLAHVKEEMTSIFQPPKNSLIKLTRGKAEITILDPDRQAPNLNLDKNKLGEEILRIIEEKGELDSVPLYFALKEGMSKGYGLPPEEWTRILESGFGEANHVIETLDMLISEGKVRQRTLVRTEGGLQGTPRFMFSLA